MSCVCPLSLGSLLNARVSTNVSWCLVSCCLLTLSLSSDSACVSARCLGVETFLTLKVVVFCVCAVQVRFSAFEVLAEAAAAVAHVADVCASGQLARVYLDRVVGPIGENACALNEHLNGLLNVLDTMFAEDKSYSHALSTWGPFR